jgi:uncharacterized YigZ family protein
MAFKNRFIQKPVFFYFIVEYTISEPSEGIYKEKGSKFLSFAFPVTDVGQVSEILAKVKKEHHAARHHCYAYSIGSNPGLVRANDDGEPASTAGKPILGQITHSRLTNILVVVVRYFGGTLLGKGGLIRAYKNATDDAIHHAKIIRIIPIVIIKVTSDYKNISEIMKIISEFPSEIISANYGEMAVLNIKIPASFSKEMMEKLNRKEGIKIDREF